MRRIPLWHGLTAIAGSGINLKDIHAVRFEFGASFGSNRGRIGFDRVELTQD